MPEGLMVWSNRAANVERRIYPRMTILPRILGKQLLSGIEGTTSLNHWDDLRSTTTTVPSPGVYHIRPVNRELNPVTVYRRWSTVSKASQQLVFSWSDEHRLRRILHVDQGCRPTPINDMLFRHVVFLAWEVGISSTVLGSVKRQAVQVDTGCWADA